MGTGSKLLGKSADLGESYTAYLFDEKFMKILREKSTKRDFVNKVNSYDLNE